jgi:hypothetical protein
MARASEELLDDLPMFAEFLNERLIRGTLQRLDWEIINGVGTGSHLTGILASSPTVLAKGALSRSDALLTAQSRIRSIGFGTPSGTVMNHTDALLSARLHCVSTRSGGRQGSWPCRCKGAVDQSSSGYGASAAA